MKKREQIMQTVIWKTEFIFEDFYNSLDDEEKKKIDRMSDEELESFLETNQKQLEKAIESGVMLNWDLIAETALKSCL